MNLRPLKSDDAASMLSWMHDPEAVRLLSADFSSKTLADCQAFIAASNKPGNNRHWAIADETDRYLGTVSLKNIDPKNGTAEFAIVTCREAWGRGCAAFAIRECLRFAFDSMKLRAVYWYVNRENLRAVRFYEKQGYAPSDLPPASAPLNNPPDPRMVWFEARSVPEEASDHA